MISAQNISSAGLSSPDICVGCCRCGQILDPCGGSVSPFQSPGHPGIDGSRAASVCYPRFSVEAASVAVDYHEGVSGFTGPTKIAFSLP